MQLTVAAFSIGLLGALALYSRSREENPTPKQSRKEHQEPSPDPHARERPGQNPLEPETPSPRGAPTSRGSGGPRGDPPGLSGRVTYADGSPAPQAHVRLWNPTNWRTTAFTRTRADGHFLLVVPDTAPGKYVIAAYVENTNAIRVHDVVLSAMPPAGSFDLRLPPVATYRGVVHSMNGGPLPGAEVTISSYLDWMFDEKEAPGFTREKTGATDGTGAFAIPGLKADPYDERPDLSYSVIVKHPGYDNEYFHFVRAKLLSLGEHSIVLHPRWKLRLTGTVQDTTGKPLTGATVDCRMHEDRNLRDQTNWGLIARAVSNRGEFALEVSMHRSDLKAFRARGGNLFISVTCPGYQLLRTSLTLDELDRFRPAFVLSPGKVATGRVTDERGRPLRGIEVHYHDALDMVSLGETTTNKQGEFRLDSLTEGMTCRVGLSLLPPFMSKYFQPEMKQIRSGEHVEFQLKRMTDAD